MLPLALTDTPTDLGASPIEHVANALILVLGTASSLTYFHFSSPRNAYAKVALAPVLAVLRTIGRVFIAVTFGALYAGALMAAIIALAERFHFLGDVVVGLLSSF